MSMMHDIDKKSAMHDIDRMIDLGAAMHAESVYAPMPYDRDKLRAYCTYYSENPEAGVGVLAEEGDTVIAMMVMSVNVRFFNNEKYASDLVIYVRKDRRGGIAAKRVLNEVEAWAKEQSIPELMVGITAGIANDKAERFYKALGFKDAGVLLKKEV